MTGYRWRVEALRRQTRAQADALAALKDVFAREAEHLHRYDQARHLDALREKIAREVSDIKRMEAAAAYGFTKATLIGGVAKFAIGSLVAAARGSREHPLSVGARWAQSNFEKTAPFGAVVVAVGPGGVPDDVNVVALSRQARELERAQSDVVAALEARGYRVMTLEGFFVALDQLKEKVLKGTSALPVAASSLEKHREGLSRTP